MSRATDAKTESGETNFWLDVIKNQSNYVWAKNAYGLAANTTAAASSALTTDNAIYDSLKLGVDSAAEGSMTLADISAGYDFFSLLNRLVRML